MRSLPRYCGDRVHGPLHREAALRPAGAAVGRDHHRVGVERLEDDPVVLRLVGAEQLGRGDDRDDQAVRRVGAVVVPELDVQPEQPAVVVEADLDVLHLAALVGGGDEVLAAVLGELHGPAERLRRQRDQQLLGPRVVDLHAEAAADVGGDHVDLAEVELQLHRDGGADAGRGLGRGPGLEPVEVGVPAGDRAAALHRLAGAALDGQVERRAGAAPRRSRPARRRRSAPAGRRRCRARRRGPGARPPGRRGCRPPAGAARSRPGSGRRASSAT